MAVAALVTLAGCGGGAALAAQHSRTSSSAAGTTQPTPSVVVTLPTSTTQPPPTTASTTTAPATTTTTTTAEPAVTGTTPATTSTVAAATVTTYPAVLTPTTAPPPAIPQPTAARPLTILEIGDSLGEDLGFGMSAVLGSDALVRVVQDAVGDTGLARPDYYDWPVHLEQELAEYHPAAVVVMLGGNDGQSFDENGSYVAFGTASWHTIYSERVAQIMDEATLAGAHVLWVGMPIMQDAGFSATMATLNSVYQQQAGDHAGVTYFSSWAVFSDAAGGYAAELPDASGQLVLVRDSDGIHIASGGCVRLASAIVPAMDAGWGVHL